MDGDGPLLVCYDGSEGAREALEAATRVLASREAVVACYWQPFGVATRRFAVDLLELVQDADSINEREEAQARQLADEGAERARAAGLDAEAAAVKISTPIDEAILNHAEDIDAAAIVLGSRSRSSLRSLILGDVANEVVQRATRPVFVSPSSALARRRHEELTRELRDSDATVTRGGQAH